MGVCVGGGGVLIVKANLLDSIQLVDGMDVTKSSRPLFWIKIWKMASSSYERIILVFLAINADFGMR